MLDEVDSTMLEAMRQGPNISGPTWILAYSQTTARGRRGRAWTNSKGNFSATLIFRPDGDGADVALYSFVTSLALFDALADLTGRTDGLTLKWPNDVLLHGGKLAGILLESSVFSGALHLAIGIGINLAAAPAAEDVEVDALRPVSLVGETGLIITPAEMLSALALRFDQHSRSFQSLGFAPIRTAWLAQAARLGEKIRARTMREEHHGTFRDVDMQGQLVLETAKARVHIPAADVFF